MHPSTISLGVAFYSTLRKCDRLVGRGRGVKRGEDKQQKIRWNRIGSLNEGLIISPGSMVGKSKFETPKQRGERYTSGRTPDRKRVLTGHDRGQGFGDNKIEFARTACTNVNPRPSVPP